ncbi:MAG TPA: protein kinase [Pseudomonadota bacterium]|nr:protein kinase [Pseudomonadota bacterium]
MIQLTRYTIVDKLHEGSETVIYRAIRDADQQPVVIKTPRSDYPTPRALANLQHEYSLLRALELPGVIKALALESRGSSLALVLEDFGGQSLSKLAAQQPLGLETILQIAIAVADTLAILHSQPIVHKDIKPHNVNEDSFRQLAGPEMPRRNEYGIEFGPTSQAE